MMGCEVGLALLCLQGGLPFSVVSYTGHCGMLRWQHEEPMVARRPQPWSRRSISTLVILLEGP
eukprot:7022708-Karenia_brevis.AAC.1